MLRRLIPPLVALAVIALVAAGCGGGSSSAGTNKQPDAVGKGKSSTYQGAVANPPKPAPGLTLKDSTGKVFNLSGFRGKVVLMTFLYVHCPDVCPLITGNLHTAVKQLGPQAAGVQVVAVSADPRGDTPKTVKKFLAAHQMTGIMRYLVGNRKQLGKVWKTWGIVSRPDKSTPDQVEHTGLVYGIAASGKITTLYPANFKPAQIVHDVPILAKN